MSKKDKKQKDIYFTLTGTAYRYGTDFLKTDMKLSLVKEPDNKFDKEAIRVELEGMGCIGYVANSVNTVKGECLSAGRLYDKIGKKASGRVLYIFERGAICKISKKDLI